jgi:hypothetical protein
MKALLTSDAEGNEITLETKDYIDMLVKELKVKDVESESQGLIPAKSAVSYVLDTIVKGKDVDPEVADKLSEVVERVKADVANTQKNAESEKDKAAREKEEKAAAAEKAKADKEAAAVQLKKDQGEFVSAVDTGYAKAVKSFQTDVDNLKSDLPEGVSIAKTESGWGVVLADGTSKDKVGEALGFFMGKVDSSEFMKNQLSFLAGDLTNEAVRLKLYPDMKSAAKGISEDLAAKGKKVSPASIESYSRLSSRTLPALRNPEADPSAYLELSRIKKAKQMDGETKEAFAERQKKLEDGITAIQTELAKGEIRNRKDVLPKILELEYQTGLKERPDPNAKKPTSITTYLKHYFLASIAIQHLDGVGEKGEKGTVRLLDEDGKTIHAVAIGDLEKLKLEAEANLLNAFWETKDVTPKDFLRGYVSEEKDEPIGTKPDGTAITEKKIVKTPVFPPVFFEIAKDEPEGDEGDSEGNAEEGEPAAEKAAEPTPEPAADEKKPATKKAKNSK